VAVVFRLAAAPAGDGIPAWAVGQALQQWESEQLDKLTRESNEEPTDQLQGSIHTAILMELQSGAKSSLYSSARIRAIMKSPKFVSPATIYLIGELRIANRRQCRSPPLEQE
jgi:hypothetical protein